MYQAHICQMGRELQLSYRNLARYISITKMQHHLQSMKNINEGEVVVEVLLGNWSIEGWYLEYLNDMVQCEVVDNNMCETFNGVFVEAKNKPFITLLEEVKRYVMSRIVVKGGYAEKWKCNFGPNIVDKLEKERNKSGK